MPLGIAFIMMKLPDSLGFLGNLAGFSFIHRSRDRIRQGKQVILLIYRRIILPQEEAPNINDNKAPDIDDGGEDDMPQSNQG